MNNEKSIAAECYASHVYTARYNELRGIGYSPKRAKTDAARLAEIAKAEFLMH
jgi:hypothetical protein